ncbi:MAG: 50S ribosomal protein L11 methyltransferase [Candidatus Magasanikbacteria bacterium]|nr:50S ribosomal protein L11 methyltransferase [Candidatus Magasanikbacteria bacterium]
MHLIYIFLIIFLFLLFATFIYAGLRGAPWVPTRKRDVERFLNLAEIKQDEKVYDLGCGNGRMILAAAKKGACGIGIEVSLFPFLLAKLNQLLNRKLKIKILFNDLWRADLSDADVVYFFLMQDILPKLKTKLEKELKKGARVVAYVWPIPGWTPIKVDETHGRPKMYLYQMINN